ncbi:unnamed protein product [Eruca vesicaria subsp. sativa]|uniref:Zinc finger PHD-type domain-containing protein n=1 Tax=Eruca vesicaria subsp. sativa TaxID=29727 RepID=A0ABC8J6U5_ERUVS|nr:unnamed protein product [Eruca vesicaria subsp. sativa]
MFGCLQCDFFVHRSCIFLPEVIKLTRHSRYLSHVFHILNEAAKCGVCQGRFSSGYGGYACIDMTCDYVVHSTCATNSNVWDGIDHVEGELEEGSSSKDVMVYSIEEMDAKKVHHFSHGHGLSRIHVDEDCCQLCEACILPIDMGTFLGCKECSFALHEECARLAPEMDHPLHRHRITVQVQMNTKESFFTCSACKQYSCGFLYQCCQEDCGFKIDAKCASFADPFKHITHKCPLYLRLEDLANRKSYLCCGCHEYSTTVATCNTCEDDSFDFKCLNLPPVIRYKYDVHPLTLYFDTEHYKKQMLEKRQENYSWGRERPPYSWCDACEEEIHENLLFYICFDCRISLHVKCILGNYPYMKPGHNIKVNGTKIQIASNSGAFRPMCHTCHSLCRDKLVFKDQDLCFCSFKCIPCTKRYW